MTEPFITPSLFEATGNNDIVDEWTFCQYQDYDTARSALMNHWDTWFTEDDFAKISGKSFLFIVDKTLNSSILSCWSEPCSHSYRILGI